MDNPPPGYVTRITPERIAGVGRTWKLVARHADAVNLCGKRRDPKLEVLAAHCEKEGRDPATISKTWLVSAVIGRRAPGGLRLVDPV